MKSIKSGLIYFYVHLVIEIVSFYILTSFLDNEQIFILALSYDFFAFVTQGFFGFGIDKKLKFPFYVVGVALSLISLTLFKFSINAFVVMFILAIGNSLIHIVAAEKTIRSSPGKMTNSSLFVAGGSFGVITGKIFSMYNLNFFIVLAIGITMFLPLFFKDKISEEVENYNLGQYNFVNTKIPAIVIIILSIFVVSIRALIGYGIPTGWNKEIYQSILLFSMMGIGKALGGILIDKLGIKITIFISTLVSIPFLIFGDSIMILSIIGVMLFSMTMAVTLAILINVNKKYPGVAFGYTTIGLFIGTASAFFINFSSLLISAIVIIILSIICFIILFLLVSKKEKNNV